jgi:hypothetical protein
MQHAPAIIGCRDSLRLRLLCVEVKWLHGAAGALRIRLVEDRLSVRELERVRIAETADAGHRAEVMIEGAVFLHHQDDVLDLLQRRSRRRGLERPADGPRQERVGKRGSRQPSLTQNATTSQTGWLRAESDLFLGEELFPGDEPATSLVHELALPFELDARANGSFPHAPTLDHATKVPNPQARRRRQLAVLFRGRVAVFAKTAASPAHHGLQDSLSRTLPRVGI